MQDVFGNRIVLADQSNVNRYRNEVLRVLALVAHYMIEEDDDPDEWAEGCLVTDLSQLNDFFSSHDPATPDIMSHLSNRIGFEVDGQSYIAEIAMRMAPPQ